MPVYPVEGRVPMPPVSSGRSRLSAGYSKRPGDYSSKAPVIRGLSLSEGFQNLRAFF